MGLAPNLFREEMTVGPEIERRPVDGLVPSQRTGLPMLGPGILVPALKSTTIHLLSRDLAHPDAGAKLSVGIGRTVTDRRHWLLVVSGASSRLRRLAVTS